jgi:hydroxypyruvate reductase
MNGSAGRRVLRLLFEEALRGADAKRAVSEALSRPSIVRALARAGEIGVFSCGKAAVPMAEGVPGRLRKRALLVVPGGYPDRAMSSAEVLFSSHPEPDGASLAAARRALDFFAGFGPKDVILCLISGGTSSLLALPRPGIALASKRRAVRRLMRSGASIVEINRLRKSLSAVKGGKLGRKTRARLITLVLSDVPGDRPSLVGSGPTIRGAAGDVALVVGSNRSGLQAAARRARKKELEPRLRRGWLSGEAAEEGRRFARCAARLKRGQVLLAGGETTVTIRGTHGRGGRNLEFALGAALELAGTDEITIRAAGSDGIDGSSRAAGAFADGRTIARALRLGLDPARALAHHDTEPFFDRLGDLLVPGPTGTNVCDWAFALSGP